MRRGELFILSAPSGTGKTTLIRGMLEGGLDDVAFSISHTTRKPRQGEVAGVDYHFVDHETFRRMLTGEEFLEWAEVHNNYYGTSRQEVFPRLEGGIDVLMDIDVQGAERVMGRHAEAHGIFIMPPSYEDLERRLQGRGLDGPDEIARRLAVSVWEIRRVHQYQYVIVNDDAKRATEDLAAIILEKRHRMAAMQERVTEILRDFEEAAGPEAAALRAQEAGPGS